jgi:hypothetical protein
MQLPVAKEFGYHQMFPSCNEKGPWLYHRIISSKTPIDIAFIGSSHTMLGIQDSTLQEKMDHQYNVTNLGFCRYGRSLHYKLTRELLVHKTPKLIVYEVREVENRISHPDFFTIADAKDILVPVTLCNTSYFKDLLKAIGLRFKYLKYGDIAPGEPIEHSDFSHEKSSNRADPDFLQRKSNRKRKKYGRFRASTMEHRISSLYSKKYLGIMAKNVETEGGSIAFIYLPSYGNQLPEPIDAEFYKGLGELFIPPASILENTENWSDDGHLNNTGATAITTWLYPHLISYLQ